MNLLHIADNMLFTDKNILICEQAAFPWLNNNVYNDNTLAYLGSRAVDIGISVYTGHIVKMVGFELLPALDLTCDVKI